MGYHTEFLGGLDIDTSYDPAVERHLGEYSQLMEQNSDLKWIILSSDQIVDEMKADSRFWGLKLDDFEYHLVWNGEEKFEEYIELLHSLIYTYFNKWNWILNGSIVWKGEDPFDAGIIFVKDNNLSVIHEENDKAIIKNYNSANLVKSASLR